jgi:hypothetical protein
MAAAPVDSHREARSPEGLLHLLGNVGEMTESIAVTRSPFSDALEIQRTLRFYASSTWDSVFWEVEPLSFGFFHTSNESATCYTGFRCAKGDES